MRSALIFGLSLVLSFIAQAATSTDAVPPVLKNPLAMTITQTLIGPTKDLARRDQVTLLPSRKNTFLLEDSSQLSYTYHLQPKSSAPLIFILPGTGGLSTSPGALFLEEQLYNMGYHTVTVDNGFSWRFAVSGSRSGVPGYTPADSADLYLALKKVNSKLKKENSIKPASYSLMGYSLGALEGVFIQQQDEQEGVFHFSKLLMIDPPVDLLHAVSELDYLYDIGDVLSPDEKLRVFNRSLDVGADIIQKHSDIKDPVVFQQAFDDLKFNNRDMAFLIGGNFRDSLRDVFFATQQIHDVKILKNQATRYHRNARYEEARKYSFKDYMKNLVLPALQAEKGADYTVADLNRESSLYQFGDFIKSRGNVYLIESADDFLLKDGDLPWLMDKFGKNALIFPYGGHCGSMNFPQFHDQLVRIFKFKK